MMLLIKEGDGLLPPVKLQTLFLDATNRVTIAGPMWKRGHSLGCHLSCHLPFPEAQWLWRRLPPDHFFFHLLL